MGSSIYAVSNPNDPNTEIVYKGEDLRPFPCGSCKAIYTVYVDNLDIASPAKVKELFKSWAGHLRKSGRIVVFKDTWLDYPIDGSPSKTILLLTINSCPCASEILGESEVDGRFHTH